MFYKACPEMEQTPKIKIKHLNIKTLREILDSVFLTSFY